MADFIKFKANGRFVLINAEQITDVGPYIKGWDNSTLPYAPIFDDSKTKISVVGTEDNFLVVDETFEQVCDKLKISQMPDPLYMADWE